MANIPAGTEIICNCSCASCQYKGKRGVVLKKLSAAGLYEIKVDGRTTTFEERHLLVVPDTAFD